MTTDTAVRPALAAHPFVAGLPPRLVEELGALARDARFSQGELIFREGDDCHDFFLILEGRVGLEITHGRGTLRVQTLGAGEEFGWSAVMMGRGKYFQARALEPVSALAFDGGAVMTLCRQDPELGFELMYRLLGVVSERLQATRLQLIDMYWPPARRAGA